MLCSFVYAVCHHYVKNVIVFDSILLHQMLGYIFWLNSVLLRQRVRNPAGKNFLVFQTFQHFLDHMVTYVSLCCQFSECCMSIPSDELTNFSFVLSVWKVHTGNKHKFDWQCLCSFLKNVFTHGMSQLESMQ
jgi:hypothetical protein